MYNLLIALAAGLAVAVAVLLAHLPWYCLLYTSPSPRDS